MPLLLCCDVGGAPALPRASHHLEADPTGQGFLRRVSSLLVYSAGKYFMLLPSCRVSELEKFRRNTL